MKGKVENLTVINGAVLKDFERRVTICVPNGKNIFTYSLWTPPNSKDPSVKDIKDLHDTIKFCPIDQMVIVNIPMD